MARTAAQAPAAELIPAADLAADADHTSALALLNDSTRDIIRNFSLASANPDVLCSEIRGYQASAVEAMFHIGVRLMVLRQVVPHGEWTKRLEGMGLSDRTARKITTATIKFADPRKSRSDKLLSLGKTKLIELLVLDDEDLDTLDGGGEVGELDLDDVACMSVSELRAALRELRQHADAKDSLIRAKDDKINDLDVKLKQAKKFKPSPDSIAKTQAEQAALDEVAAAVREVELGVARLSVVVGEALDTIHNEAVQARMAEQLRYVHARVAECLDHHVQDKLAGSYVPEWARAADANTKPGKQG
jgi:hypothetical protein